MLFGSDRPALRVFGDLRNAALHGAVVLLALMGIAGVIFKVFRPEGWLAQWMGGTAHADVMEVLAGLAIAAWAGLCAKHWFDGIDAQESRGDILLYVALGLGLFFTFEWVVNGVI